MNDNTQPQYDTILNFSLGPDREYAVDAERPIEHMENTYIPKSEHLARLKFFRLENLKSSVRIVRFNISRLKMNKGLIPE